jgi:hypothetical protein
MRSRIIMFFESFHVESLSKWPLHSKVPTSPLAQSLLPEE